MAERRHPNEPPLASFVLRVTGRPAVLHYELRNVRTGERHRFQRADALVAFLREQGLEGDHFGLTSGGGDGAA